MNTNVISDSCKNCVLLNTGWLDAQQVCQMLNISKKTLENYRFRKVINSTKFCGKRYYNREEILIVFENNYTYNSPKQYNQ